jgi:hypothetical protein
MDTSDLSLVTGCRRPAPAADNDRDPEGQWRLQALLAGKWPSWLGLLADRMDFRGTTETVMRWQFGDTRELRSNTALGRLRLRRVASVRMRSWPRSR